MCKNLIIKRYANNFCIAKFESVIESEGPDKGNRVKHYVYQDTEGRGYWHEVVYLSSAGFKPLHTYDSDVSDRLFWGKVRLVRHRSLSLPETWAAIAFAIENIERIKIRESHE